MLPPAASSYAPWLDQLFYIILGITTFFFVLVEGVLLYFIIRYRHKPGRRAHYTHGNTKVEIIWTVIPALILLWLAFASQNLWDRVKGSLPANADQIEIVAEQFAWNIRYAGADKMFNTEDDVTTLNQLHMPLNEPVVIWLTSKDVIHSFFVPEFRIKQDAVPGMTGRLWITATKAGDYELACAELCGLGHYRMKGFVKVEPREQLEQWLLEQKEESA